MDIEGGHIPIPQGDTPVEDLPPEGVIEKLTRVYGDCVHQNDGTHLDGGIRDDAVWQERWRKVVGLPPQRYNAPNEKVGRLFVKTLAEELEGVTTRRWNSERFIVFQAVILQRSGEVKKSKDIWRRIETRLRDWKLGKYDMLIQETVRTSIALVQKITRGETEASQVKTFTRMVLQGKIRQAVRFVTERGQGGALAAEDMVQNKDGTESSVEEILMPKHPDAIIPDVVYFRIMQ